MPKDQENTVPPWAKPERSYRSSRSSGASVSSSRGVSVDSDNTSDAQSINDEAAGDAMSAQLVAHLQMMAASSEVAPSSPRWTSDRDLEGELAISGMRSDPLSVRLSTPLSCSPRSSQATKRRSRSKADAVNEAMAGKRGVHGRVSKASTGPEVGIASSPSP